MMVQVSWFDLHEGLAFDSFLIFSFFSPGGVGSVSV
jgi:hypothetical protein